MFRFARVCLMVAAVVAWALAVPGSAQATPIPIADYNMEQSSSLLNQVTGQTAIESGSGTYAYHQAGVSAGTYGAITLTNSTGYSAALSGSGAWWDLSSADNTAMQMTNNFTVMAWVQVPDTGVHGILAPSTWDGWGLHSIGTSGDQGLTFAWLGHTSVSSGTALPVNTWVHVAATKSASTGYSVYVNGVLAANSVAYLTGDIGVTTGTYAIGAYGTWASALSLDGSLDEVRVYNTALTQSQIVAAAEATNNVPEPSTLVLLATGLIGLLCYAWRKRR